MKLRNLFLLGALMFSPVVQAEVDWFMPEGAVAPVYEKDAETNGMTEARFNEIIDIVSAVYAPIFRAQGATLKVVRKWSDPTVNASAQQMGSTWVVNMYGGLARHKVVTDDAFALVVCHELGHHVGGAPKSGFSWASNEGQSDYYGAAKCFKRVFKAENVQPTEVDPLVRGKCASVYQDDQANVALCERTSMAGYSLGQLLGGGEFSTPDKTVVTRTNDAHPKSQCRLDTYFAGALCKQAEDLAVSNTNPDTGFCPQSTYQIGFRPRCWFKPAAKEVVFW